MAEFSFEIIKDYGTIGEPTASGWQTHLTKVSWNGREPKFDIRQWSPEFDKMGKGVSFTADELNELENRIAIVNSGFEDYDDMQMTREEMLQAMQQDVMDNF